MPREGASGLWRSEDMIRLDVITQREVLYDTVVCVGLLGKAQFVDVNGGGAAFTRPYTAEIRRYDELERKLSIINVELEGETDLSMQGPPALGTPDHLRRLLCGTVLEEEEKVDALLEDLKTVNASLQDLRREMNFRLELSLLHTRLQDLLPSHLSQPSDALLQAPHLLGMVDAARAEVIYAMTYRATKGNALVELDNKHAMLLDPLTGERCVAKIPFAVFTSSPAVLKRVERLILSLGATIHTLREVSEARTEEHEHEMGELQHMYERMQLRKSELLQKHALMHSTFLRVVQMKKHIFLTMNLCVVRGSTCTASVWIPRRHEEALRTAIREAVHTAAGNVASVVAPHPSQSNPPTFFETNKFTRVFQSIVDSYGTARYKEVNPGVFTIVTFPYLFGIMYGDIGHGILLLLFALYFVLMETRWSHCHLNEMLAMLFGGRYLLLLMGLFSIYMGALYNDFFGFSVGFFSSAYAWPPIGDQKGTVHPLGGNNRTGVYPVGLDVAWTETENKLEFYNSVKMKCAVIVGVVQMLTGNVLSLLNHIHNRDLPKIFFLFIPELLFLLCTFGYMSLLIVIKWCVSWENTSEAPSILETMTNFFLQPGTVTQPLYKGQSLVQVILLLTAFAMVPAMLIMMPLLEARKHRGASRGYCLFTDNLSLPVISRDTSSVDGEQTVTVSVEHRNDPSSVVLEGVWRAHSDAVADRDRVEDTSAWHVPHSTADAPSHAAAAGDVETGHPFDLSEVIIHYMIHTIEYVLGCVSNTASYLRLWALSLAHAQLSEVFFTFAVVKTLAVDTTGVLIAAGVAVWLGVTLAVLVGMEALSAFLHALRLHWVEFNNKFYVGDGVSYEPFELLGSVD
ncbi:putative vacuolar proton-ATPase-like protein [Trypanosoma conorhini]|uniref:V-type proton ATPase subunit a n=1 Tax=Trypanosoma conorhini TaxID=83891 RepID=A0A422NEX8_9TRYP|nr:putative vacuolar proton-ATPase-like protein [Trypanosoma conorhini]RNF04031.1 putative vacuolar proton-ATPase-like protein [Trypanosoma conorhini]